MNSMAVLRRNLVSTLAVSCVRKDLSDGSVQDGLFLRVKANCDSHQVADAGSEVAQSYVCIPQVVDTRILTLSLGSRI